ncbi:MAG: ABC transporter ATP-binding protein [Nitrospiraceae bacterium]|jgi:ABC-2 type transport system ATP-binding protein|nr:ABC transporter ATP-binding protein [Nitrospiraceae bacterium]
MITITGLAKTYGTIRAVHDLSLSIGGGEVFGLLGPNGAGKTTTIKMLTLLASPTAGSATIDGLSIASDKLQIKRCISVVPQENNLDRELTAYENLQIYSMLHGISDYRTKIEACLNLVELWDRRDSLINKFSGGMQRRLLIARALLSDPKVLFLDEPSIGLDPQIRRQMWDVIRKTRIDGRTVILTTHYIEEAEALCDRVGIMTKGTLIALDTPANLLSMVGEYVVEYVNGEGKLMQQICRNREEAHAAAQGRECCVTIRKSNLEDVFIRLTGDRIE